MRAERLKCIRWWIKSLCVLDTGICARLYASAFVCRPTTSINKWTILLKLTYVQWWLMYDLFTSVWCTIWSFIIYNSGWWNTWSVEATKTVAKYERVGEPQRTRLLNHMSNAHCALPPVQNSTAWDGRPCRRQKPCFVFWSSCHVSAFRERTGSVIDALAVEVLVAHTAGHSWTSVVLMSYNVRISGYL